MTVEYREVNKESYDFVCVGDLIKVNDWKVPYRVTAVSEHFILATRTQFGKLWYTIIDKEKFICGPDNLVFGPLCDIKIQPEKELELMELGRLGKSIDDESPVVELSNRHRLIIDKLFVKFKA